MVLSTRFPGDASAAQFGVMVALLTLLAWVGRWIWSWYRLRHIPGPAFASVSVGWLVQKLASGRFHEHMLKVSDQYGLLVRIGPNDVLCTDPDTLRRISAVRSSYTRGIFYKTGRMVPGHDNVVSLRDDVEHKVLRAKMAGAYSGKECDSLQLEYGIDQQLLRLVELIDAKYISDPGSLRPFDISTKAEFFALDVISYASFGSSFGFLTADKDLYQYLEISESAKPVMNMLGAMPWLTDILYRWPLRLVLPSDGDKVGFGRLMGLAKAKVEERLHPNAKPGRDMLQYFINSGMTYDELIQHMFIQIIAGSTTTATAIYHTLLALISTPTVYATLQREIDARIASGLISSPIITDSEAQAFPYLQAVIRESLRMWPPTTGLGSKQAPEGGDTICGYYVPGGTQVAHNFFGMMRLKSIWGEDADVFRPERWLEAEKEEERVKYLNSVVDLDFGSGKYQCLGKRIASMELNKIFIELLRRFDFAVVDPHNPIRITSGLFWIASDLWLRVTRRN